MAAAMEWERCWKIFEDTQQQSESVYRSLQQSGSRLCLRHCSTAIGNLLEYILCETRHESSVQNRRMTSSCRLIVGSSQGGGHDTVCIARFLRCCCTYVHDLTRKTAVGSSLLSAQITSMYARYLHNKVIWAGCCRYKHVRAAAYILHELLVTWFFTWVVGGGALHTAQWSTGP